MTSVEKSIPEKGISRSAMLNKFEELRKDDADWKSGKAFCLVYDPGPERKALIREAYDFFFSENALNPSAFPSLRHLETEVVTMTANLLHGDNDVSGTMTSGGTESILMAVKTAREWAKDNKPEVKMPEIIYPASVHPAFHKAFHYFGIKGVEVPVGKDFRADISAVRKAINKNTIMLVGSAPSYPHGVVDPIRDLSDLALEHELLLHVDSCIGGYLLPFVRKLGHAVPDFDFLLPGVTSISADVHKFGYAAKGASVILYRTPELRKYQFYVYTDWSGGIYGSTTMLGTRSGGAIAAAWAALSTIGMDGYMEMAKRTMRATDRIRQGIAEIPGLEIIGDPDMSIIAFRSEEINIYMLADELNLRGWNFERQQLPPSIHLTLSQVHTDAIVDEFLNDLTECMELVSKVSWNKVTANAQVTAVKGLKKMLPEKLFHKLQEAYAGNAEVGHGRSAAMYGMMGVLSGSGDLVKMVRNVLDGFYSNDKAEI